MIDSVHVFELSARFTINIVTMGTLIFGLYYRRYRDKELCTSASMFNIFAFGVLSILSSVEFGLATGFGLFAILALFTLRSEQITKIEITYFFGAVSIAVICAIPGTEIEFVALVAGLVLVFAYAIDHPRLLRSADGVKITLDKIDTTALSEPVRMRAELSERLGVEVMAYQIVALDYIHDMAQLNVFYRK